MPPDDGLTTHLRDWLGAWPPRARIDVVPSPRRAAPGWDGRVAPLLGVGDGERTVVSVPPGTEGRARALVVAGFDDPDAGRALGRLLGLPDAVLGVGVFRWTTDPADLEPAGTWVDRGDPRVPAWLRPFNGDVLVAFDDGGTYLAGVGRKQHDAHGHELSVGTDPAARGRGLARRLVVQAARRVLADGAVPTYLHDPSNTASAKVADAAGFPDRGWSVVGLWPRAEEP